MLLGMAVRMGLDLNLYRKNEHGKVFTDEDRTRAYEVSSERGDFCARTDSLSSDSKQGEDVDFGCSFGYVTECSSRSWTRPIADTMLTLPRRWENLAPP
jgi:hypothetical protein